MRLLHGILGALALCGAMAPAHTAVVYSASGLTAADITSTVDDFRSALGTLNPNLAGSLGTGRREINWDGVPDTLAAPNLLPGDFFNAATPGRARGVVLGTPGTGLQVSASAVNPTGTPAEFGNIDPNYPGFFSAFSPQRLFTAVGSNIVDVNFFIPGTSTPAFVTGFGAVFSDVDFADSATLSFFGVGGSLLGSWAVPAITGDETFSFLGIRFDDPIIGRVRITSGNQVLAAGNTQEDLVVMDDFIFGEPTLQAAVPEPGTWTFMLLGFGAVGWSMRRDKAGLPRRT
jgi:hypothetical protein